MNANWSAPHIDPEAPLQFVINAAAGSNAAENKRQLIEAALHAAQSLRLAAMARSIPWHKQHTR